MKKALKITGIVIGVLLLILIVVPIVLRGKIDQIVKKEAASMLDARLDFDRLGISLIRHFPHASLDLKGLTLVGTEPFAEDTLVSAGRISVVVNLMSLFGDSGFEVTRLVLSRPSVTALKLADGRVNWNIVKESGGETPADTAVSEPSSFKLSMKDVRIDGGKIVFVDDSSKTAFSTDRLDLRLSGNMAADRSGLNLTMVTRNLRFMTGNTAWVRDAEVETEINLDADFENGKYTLQKNRVRLNAIELGLDGWVALDGDAVDMDLKLNTSEVRFKDILSLIPAFYMKDFEDLTASGDLTFAASAAGRYEGDCLPKIDAVLAVEKGAFKYASLPLGVDDIRLNASVFNPGGSADRTELRISDFSARVGQTNNLLLSLSVTTPVSDPAFDGKVTGAFDLGVVKDVYPLGDSVSLGGRITAGIEMAGRMSDVEKKRYEKLRGEGNVALQNMVFRTPELPEVKVAEAVASVTPAAMKLARLDVTVGRSDLVAQGELSNYLPYVLRGEMLAGRLSVSSDLLDLNQLLGNSASETPEEGAVPADTAALSAFEVPKNLDLALNTSFKKILFQKMTITDLTGDVTVKDGTAKLGRLNMNALGGSIRTSGSYSTAQNPKSPELTLDVNVDKASFSRTFEELDMVKKFVPVFEKTGGNYSMTLDMTARMDEHMEPVLNSVAARGVLESSDIHVQNIKAFDRLAAVLKDDRLKKIEAKDVKISFTIADGRIETSPFDLKLGNVGLNLSGSTGLDQTIDYVASVALPSGTAGGYLNKVNVNIGGTFSSPEISLGVKEMAQDAVKQALGGALGKLTGGKSAVSTEGAADQAEKLRADAKAAGDELIEAAKQQGDKLVEQAKNPLAKIAAKKSAEALVKAAEQQARKLSEEAEARIAGTGAAE